MNHPSNAAKAAAVLHHTYGVTTNNRAVGIYNGMAESRDCDETLADHEGVWEALDGMSWPDVCGSVEGLAQSIDACFEELGSPDSKRMELMARTLTRIETRLCRVALHVGAKDAAGVPATKPRTNI
jgi:hypothetical protein